MGNASTASPDWASMCKHVAATLYGSGLRLKEGLSLRVKDVDLERRELVVRSGAQEVGDVDVRHRCHGS